MFVYSVFTLKFALVSRNWTQIECCLLCLVSSRHWVREYAMIHLPAWMDKCHSRFPWKSCMFKSCLLLRGFWRLIFLALLPILFGKYAVSVSEARTNTSVAVASSGSWDQDGSKG